MKKFFTTLILKEFLKPLVLFFLFLALFSNVNAQSISTNTIYAPAVVIGNGSFEPGVIVGTDVKVLDFAGSCPNVSYEWVSASNSIFTENVQLNLAATKDYNPGTVSTTTFFRRIAKVECGNGDFSARTATSGIKIIILN